MKTQTLELTVRVTYTKEDGTDLTLDELRALRRNLNNVPPHAAGVGAFTGSCDAVQVEAWDHGVAIVDDAVREEKPQWPRPTTN